MKIFNPGRKTIHYYGKSVFQTRFEISLDLVQTESLYFRNTIRVRTLAQENRNDFP